MKPLRAEKYVPGRCDPFQQTYPATIPLCKGMTAVDAGEIYVRVELCKAVEVEQA